MSEVFEGYERQHYEISGSLSRKCAAASALDGEKKKQKLSEIQSGVQEAESLMDLEACSLQPSVKSGLLAKTREYKSGLNNTKSELKRISASNAQQATREELLEAGMADEVSLNGVDDYIDKSKKILEAMLKRMDRNKWIVGGTVTTLVLAILFILYFNLAH